MLGKSIRGDGEVYTFSRLISEASGIASSVGACFCFTVGVIGAWISQLYGGWNASLSVLLWLVVGDYITGLLASVLEGRGLSSKVGFKGIAKKVVILFLVVVGHKLDVALQVTFIMNTVIYFYVTNELISLLENLGRMGVPVPQQLVNIIEILKGKSEKYENHVKDGK